MKQKIHYLTGPLFISQYNVDLVYAVDLLYWWSSGLRQSFLCIFIFGDIIPVVKSVCSFATCWLCSQKNSPS